MDRKGFMQIVVWAMQQREEGRALSIADVMTHWECSRATAFRILADYFDARGWQWPRPRETAMPRYKSERTEHPWKTDLRHELARKVAA